MLLNCLVRVICFFVFVKLGCCGIVNFCLKGLVIKFMGVIGILLLFMGNKVLLLKYFVNYLLV